MNTLFFRADYSAGLSGFALFAMSNGEIRGTDVGGLHYKGTYVISEGVAKSEISMSIPAGTQLVTGICPQPMNFSFKLDFNLSGQSIQSIALPIGDIRCVIAPLS